MNNIFRNIKISTKLFLITGATMLLVLGMGLTGFMFLDTASSNTKTSCRTTMEDSRSLRKSRNL